MRARGVPAQRLGAPSGIRSANGAGVLAWIPACAGMTEGGRRNDGRGEAAGFHGNDEHMSIENLNMGVELTYEIVRRMVT